jgi:hypothetical protein
MSVRRLPPSASSPVSPSAVLPLGLPGDARVYLVVIDIHCRLPYVFGVALHPKPCTLMYTGRGLNVVQPFSYTNYISLHLPPGAPTSDCALPLACGLPTTTDPLSTAAARACHRLMVHLCFLTLQGLARLLWLGARAPMCDKRKHMEFRSWDGLNLPPDLLCRVRWFLNWPLGPSRTYDSWLL